MSGHSHNYERSFLLRGHYGYSTNLLPSMIVDSGSGHFEEDVPYIKEPSTPTPYEGTVYVVAGSSGQATFVQPDYPHPAMYMSLLQLGSLVLDIDGNRLDARFLKSFPDPKTLQQLTESYFEKGELTGVNAAALFSDGRMEFQGIEDWSLYEEGIRARRAA